MKALKEQLKSMVSEHLEIINPPEKRVLEEMCENIHELYYNAVIGVIGNRMNFNEQTFNNSLYKKCSMAEILEIKNATNEDQKINRLVHLLFDPNDGINMDKSK